MTLRLLTPVLGVAAALTWSVVSGAVPGATAEPQPNASTPPGCADVDLVFARGTGEPAGLGYVGDAFADSLRSRLGGKSMNVYAVQYPATIDFPRAVDGINDAAAHIQATVANCPKTKIVLGGFSQGAAVAGFVTADVVPPGAADSGVTGPLPPAVADHVAAVSLFGKPSPRFMNFVNQPDIVIGPKYAGKTLDSCVPGDPICSDGGDFGLHNQYVADGRVDQAADYVVGKLGYPVPAEPPPPPPADAPPPPPPPADAPPPPPAPPAPAPPAPPAPAPPAPAPAPAPGAPVPAPA